MSASGGPRRLHSGVQPLSGQQWLCLGIGAAAVSVAAVIYLREVGKDVDRLADPDQPDDSDWWGSP